MNIEGQNVVLKQELLKETLQLNLSNERWQVHAFFCISEDVILNKPSVFIAYTILCFSVVVVVWITRSASCLNKDGRKISQKNEREQQLCSLNITFSLLFLLFKILETAHENLFLLSSSLFLYSFIKIYNIFLLFIFSNILWFQEEVITIGGREWIIGEIDYWK